MPSSTAASIRPSSIAEIAKGVILGITKAQLFFSRYFFNSFFWAKKNGDDFSSPFFLITGLASN